MADEQITALVQTLGPVEREFKPAGLFGKFIRIAAGFFSVLGAYIVFNEFVMQETARWGGIVAGGIMAVLGAVVWWLMRRRKPAHYAVHQDGLVKFHGGVTTAMRWDDMTVKQSLRNLHIRHDDGDYDNIRTAYWHITDKQGQVMEVGGLGAMQRLVADRLMPRLWQNLQTVLERGETVTLGAASIDREGMACGDERIEWADVLSATCNRYIKITTDEKAHEWTTINRHDLLYWPVVRRAVEALSAGE